MLKKLIKKANFQVRSQKDKVERQKIKDSLVNDLINTVFEEKFKALGKSTEATSFFKKYRTKDIVRFALQEYYPNWNATIYGSEKWVVEFLPNVFCIKTKRLVQHSSHRASRNIRKIIAISPNESNQNSELVGYTTYNSVSNFNRKNKDDSEEEDNYYKAEEEENDLNFIEQLFKKQSS